MMSELIAILTDYYPHPQDHSWQFYAHTQPEALLCLLLQSNQIKPKSKSEHHAKDYLKKIKRTEKQPPRHTAKPSSSSTYLAIVLHFINHL